LKNNIHSCLNYLNKEHKHYLINNKNYLYKKYIKIKKSLSSKNSLNNLPINFNILYNNSKKKDNINQRHIMYKLSLMNKLNNLLNNKNISHKFIKNLKNKFKYIINTKMKKNMSNNLLDSKYFNYNKMYTYPDLKIKYNLLYIKNILMLSNKFNNFLLNKIKHNLNYFNLKRILLNIESKHHLLLKKNNNKK
jgi:hypothetical protein